MIGILIQQLAFLGPWRLIILGWEVMIEDNGACLTLGFLLSKLVSSFIMGIFAWSSLGSTYGRLLALLKFSSCGQLFAPAFWPLITWSREVICCLTFACYGWRMKNWYPTSLSIVPILLKCGLLFSPILIWLGLCWVMLDPWLKDGAPKLFLPRVKFCGGLL